MRVVWCWKTQQSLQKPLNMCRWQEVVATRDQCHALMRIIHHNSKMIGSGHFFSRQNDVAERHRIDGDPFSMFLKTQWSDHRGCLRRIEAQGLGEAGRNALAASVFRQIMADARIERAFGAMWCHAGAGDLVDDVLAGTEAGIDQPVLC